MGSASVAIYAAIRRSGIPASWRWCRNQAVILCFHNVVPDQMGNRAGEGPLHLSVSRFRTLVDWMAGTFRIVPLGDIVDRLTGGVSVRGLAAITVDDAYRGFCRLGIPILNQYGVPASLFVVTDFAEAPRPFWWDRLGRDGKLDPTDRLRCRDDLRGDDHAINAAYPVTGLGELPDELLPATWSELKEVASDSIRLESHSRTHPNLTRLTELQLADELLGSREKIAARTGRLPEHISYPFGETSRLVAAAARAAGYRGGLALSFGSVRPGSDPHNLIRINVPASISLDALACWTAGVRWTPRR